MADTFRTTQDSSSLQIQNYVTVSVACLLVYEHALTYDREVKLFWRRSVTGSSILFFINRYLPLVVNLTNMRYLRPSTEQLCNALVDAWNIGIRPVYTLGFLIRLKGICAQLQQLVEMAAIHPDLPFFPCTHGHQLPQIELSHSSIVVDSDIVRCIFTVDMSRKIENNCTVSSLSHQSDATATKAYLVTIISRLCLVAADLMVMGITWKATYRTSRDIIGRRSSLSSILLRDGAIYFITLAIMNILHLSFSLSSILGTLASSNSLIVIFTEAFTAILISRFLMDLQAASDAAMHQHSGVSSLSSLNFNRVIGALGSSLPAIPESENDLYRQGMEGRIEVNDNTRFAVYDDAAYESRIPGLEGGGFYIS
ncbi:hypothetical protein C8Q74DRAFT_845384 [Fomes fomentarius]|nr:hypothetical protein C8Q74DRAFT_845384 [Fomes fomentarius]